jgi:hypothetical protein
MPADFPKDVPVPKAAKPVEASKRKDGTRHLKLQTPGSMADTVAFLQETTSGQRLGHHGRESAGGRQSGFLYGR